MYAIPPLIPAAKFLPVFPNMTILPPVMYSHPWSPTPSTTAVTPEFLTANLSPAIPLIYASPETAPNKHTLPVIIFSSALKEDSFGFLTIILAPDRPLPR